jgi:hypothetical protein
MLAAGVPLYTAYSISGAGLEKGGRGAFAKPHFIGVFTFLIAAGAAIAVIPGSAADSCSAGHSVSDQRLAPAVI